MNFLKAFVKFVPVFVLAGLMISGQDALIAAAIAAVTAIVVARFVCGIKFQECIDSAMASVSNILIALFILMFAYAMASLFMSTGVGAAVVNIALKAGITGKSVACIGILCTAVLSVATGTSWGTFAACAPIFLWLNEIVGGNLYLTVCAIAGGACFGDNIGLISDTTIVSSGLQGVEVFDRIRHQGVWSLSCLLLAGIITFIVGTVEGLSTETVDATGVISTLSDDVWAAIEAEKPVAVDLLHQVEAGVPYYMIIPLILVVVMAVMGINTFICITSGIVTAAVLGGVAGLVVSPMDFIDLVLGGFAEAGSWAMQVMMWVSAFGGVMASIHAFEPISRLIVKLSKNVRQLTFYNGLFCLIGNACLSDEMAQIVTCGPIIKDITEENVVASEEDMYKLKLRNATLSDAMGVYGSQLIPWHCYIVFYIGMATAVYPLAQISVSGLIFHNYMAWVAVISMLLLTLTGLDRFIPLFKLPKEPQVYLKKNAKEAA